MNTLLGKSIDRYHVVEQLGQGGMATVYRAYDTRLDRDVAMKVIRSEAISPELTEEVLKRFEREAKSLGKMSHSNIVKVYDYGEHEGAPYLVMEYLTGGTLKEHMGRPMPFYEAAKLLLPIARALQYAHSMGVIHRDVKPANIMLTPQGQPMLTDFGIAKLLESGGNTALTGTGVGIGTPEYMAPEQGMGDLVDHRADIYALGVVFFEMITGNKPFRADTPLAVLIKHINDPLPRPKQFIPNLPDDVEKVIFKAMAKRPAERYPDMQAFGDALERLSTGRSGTGTGPLSASQPVITPPPPPPIYRSAAPAVQTAPSPPIHSYPSTPLVAKKSSPLPWIIGGGVILLFLLAVLAIGSFLLLNTQDNAQVTVNAAVVQTEAASAGKPSAAPKDTQAAKTEGVPEATTSALPQAGEKRSAENDGMLQVYVPAGDFRMGSELPVDAFARADELPLHVVAADGFWMDQTEVTNQQFTRFVKETGYKTLAENGMGNSWMYNKDTKTWEARSGLEYNWRTPQGKGSNIAGLDQHPVVQMNWQDAEAYCKWAGRRMPTEAEWEKTARGSDGRVFPWGNQPPSDKLANFADKNAPYYTWANKTINDGYEFTAPVGSYPQGASPYGALDMAGNVWEWVSDFYQADYYHQSPNLNPTGPSTAANRVSRGGSADNWMNDIRSARRLIDPVDGYGAFNGFRCVQSQADDKAQAPQVPPPAEIKPASGAFGNAINPPWFWLGGDNARWSINHHKLTIDNSDISAEIYGGNHNPKGILLQPAPPNNYTIETTVNIVPRQNYQQAGLMVLQDTDNYIKLDKLWNDNLKGPAVEFIIEKDGAETKRFEHNLSSAGKPISLRIARSGSTFTSSYSENGSDWQTLGTFEVEYFAPNMGIFTFASFAPTSVPAEFDYFNVH